MSAIYAQKKRWWLRLREKNGKVNEMPCHHKLEFYLDEYIKSAGIGEDRKGPLFRSAISKTGKLSEKPMGRTDVWYMVRRRANDAGLATAIGCHTFRHRHHRLPHQRRQAGNPPNEWPGIPTPKPPASTTAATMTSASAKSSAWGFKA